MTRQRIFTLAAALLVAAGLAGCSIGPVNLDEFVGVPSVEEAREARRSELTPTVANSALKQPGTLTVGILATQTAPLSIVYSNGTQSGVDYDMAYALADEMGLSSVSFVSVSDVDDALAETCDVVMGVSSTDDVDATVVGGYAQRATGLFTRGEVSAPVDASSLDGATVGLQEGSVSAMAIDEYELNLVRTSFPNLINEAFDALEEGSVQYVACDAYAGAYLATAYTDVSFVGTFDEPVPVGIAVADGELQSIVQTALGEVESGGVADVARALWVGDMPVLSSESVITGLVERVEEPANDDETTDGDETDAADGVTDEESSEFTEDGMETSAE